MAAMGEVTRNDDSKQHEQESYQTKPTTPQEIEDFKGQSENPTQLSKKLEGSISEDESAHETISTSQPLQNVDGNNSITAHEKMEIGICQSQQGVQQNEASMEDKPSVHDPVGIGRNSTEEKPQFPVKEEKSIKSQIMEETRTNPTEKTMFNNKNIQDTLCSQTTDNPDVTGLDGVHHEDQEAKKVVNSEADTSIHVGHNSTEREPQFPVKGEKILESQMMDEAKTNQSDKTVLNNTSIQQTSHSQTTENSDVTGLDGVHHEDQEAKKVMNSEADTSIHLGHNSTEREPQFPDGGEKILESQMMDEAKTNQSEETVFNNTSIQQTSHSQTTENSDVWENLQEFGEFRLQRRVSTIPTNIHAPSHTQHKEKSHLQQWSKTSEESISEEGRVVFLAGTLTSHDCNKIIKAAENTDAEETPTVTFSKIYFITFTDLEMLHILRPPNNAGFEGLPKNSIHLCTQIDSSTTEDKSVINKTTTNIHSTVAISDLKLADEKLIYKDDNVSHGVAVSDAVKVTEIPTMNEDPKSHNAEGVSIQVSKETSISEERTEVTTRTDQAEFKSTESTTTEIVNTGYGIYQTQKHRQTEQLQQASGFPTVAHMKSPEIASGFFSEKAAAGKLTSTPQAQELGKSTHLEGVSNMPATTIVTTDSISHETVSIRLTVQHPEGQLSNEVLTSKTDKDTDPKTDKATKAANNNHVQEGKSEYLHIQQKEASSDDKASSKDGVVMTQISTASDLVFPVKNNILATQKVEEAETNQAREMKFNQITECSEIWETLQGFGEFRLQRKVTKHYSEICGLSHTGKKEEPQLEQSETPLRSQDMSHTQHAVFLAGILDVNESDKIFKAVAYPHAEVLPAVTFKKIVFILPTDLEVVQRMTQSGSYDFKA